MDVSKRSTKARPESAIPRRRDACSCCSAVVVVDLFCINPHGVGASVHEHGHCRIIAGRGWCDRPSGFRDLEIVPWIQVPFGRPLMEELVRKKCGAAHAKGEFKSFFFRSHFGSTCTVGAGQARGREGRPGRGQLGVGRRAGSDLFRRWEDGSPLLPAPDGA